MAQVKHFLESLNKLSTSDQTIKMEVVGDNSDIYQNLFPVIADVSVYYRGKNELGESVSCDSFDVLFVDEKASSEDSKCQHKIIMIRDGDKYDIKKGSDIPLSIREIGKVLKARDISFF